MFQILKSALEGVSEFGMQAGMLAHCRGTFHILIPTLHFKGDVSDFGMQISWLIFSWSISDLETEHHFWRKVFQISVCRYIGLFLWGHFSRVE